MTARELEALLIKHYDPDFRMKGIIGPVGSFHLADSFEECGLDDPRPREPSGAYGLWQMMPSRSRDRS